MDLKKYLPSAPFITLGIAMVWSGCSYPAEKALSELEEKCAMTTDTDCAVEITLDGRLTGSEINYVSGVLRNTTACRLSAYEDKVTQKKIYFVERKTCDTPSIYPNLSKSYMEISDEVY
ncbi:MAG: hypothetical protein AABX05_04240 [Nanoarchaeota archaeon]